MSKIYTKRYKKVSKLAKMIYPEDIIDQLPEGYCTGNSTAKALQIISKAMRLKGTPLSIPSFYGERYLVNPSLLTKCGGELEVIKDLISGLGLKWLIIDYKNLTLSYDIYEEEEVE